MIRFYILSIHEGELLSESDGFSMHQNTQQLGNCLAFLLEIYNRVRLEYKFGLKTECDQLLINRAEFTSY